MPKSNYLRAFIAQRAKAPNSERGHISNIKNPEQNNRSEKHRQQVTEWATTLSITILTLFIPYAALGWVLPMGGDSGVFMYGGKAITEGEIPYRDFWDHKGPLLYLFNALGFYLFQSFSGIFMLEGALLCACVFVSSHYWKQEAGLTSARILILAGSSSYFNMFVGGNYVETWFFPFQILSYTLLIHGWSLGSKSTSQQNIAITTIASLTLAIGLSLKPNIVAGLTLLSLAFIISRPSPKERAYLSAYFIFLTLAVIAILLKWLYAHNAENDFFDQYISYNLFYTKHAGRTSRVEAATALAKYLLYSPLCLYLASTMHRQTTIPDARGTPVKKILILLLTFTSDFASQTISTTAFPHYCIVILPSMIMLGALVDSREEPQEKETKKNKFHLLLMLTIPSAVILLSSAAGVRVVTSTIKSGLRIPDNPQRKLIETIGAHSASTDQILVHGPQSAWIYAASERRPASRLIYSLPIIAEYKNLYNEYTRDIRSGNARLIIEDPQSCGLTIKVCQEGKPTYNEAIDYLTSHYQKTAEINGYRIWEKK